MVVIPVHVFQAEPGHLAGPQAVDSQEDQDRSVTDVHWATGIEPGQKTFDVGPGKGLLAILLGSGCVGLAGRRPETMEEVRAFRRV